MKLKNNKGKKNIYRIIWVSCIFLVLIVILVMIMDYKINYEYLEENNLYFYNCDGNLCTTEVKDNSLDLYSVYECRYEECPKFTSIINENYVLLRDNDNSYELYNYKDGNVISAGYDSYIFIDNNYIIVSKGNKYGVIDIDDNVIEIKLGANKEEDPMLNFFIKKVLVVKMKRKVKLTNILFDINIDLFL